MEVLEGVVPPDEVGGMAARRRRVGVGLLAAPALDHAGRPREHVEGGLGQGGRPRAGHQHHLKDQCGQGLMVVVMHRTFDLFGQSFVHASCFRQLATRRKDARRVSAQQVGFSLRSRT